VHLIVNSELRIRLQRAADVRKRVKDLKQTQQEMDEDDEKRKQAKKRELKMKADRERKNLHQQSAADDERLQNIVSAASSPSAQLRAKMATESHEQTLRLKENEAEQRRKTQDRLLARRNSQPKDGLTCGVDELFSEFDTDGSGYIDSDELAAMLKELDADGRLDMSSADNIYIIDSLVEKIDTNDDGLISREELRQYLVHMGLDKNQRPRAASRAAEVAIFQEATGIQSSTAAQENSDDDAVRKWLETA
jgi:hypothetical protein